MNQVETVMRVGSMTLVTLLTSEAATLVRQRSVGLVIAGVALQVCIFYVTISRRMRKSMISTCRLMSGMLLLPHEEELIAATSLPHLTTTTFQDGIILTSRGKDSQAPILQFNS